MTPPTSVALSDRPAHQHNQAAPFVHTDVFVHGPCEAAVHCHSLCCDRSKNPSCHWGIVVVSSLGLVFGVVWSCPSP